MATYTTAAIVKNRVENLSASITTAMIEGYIEEAEGILGTLMGHSFIVEFDATKHGVLRAGANAWAAMSAIAFNPSGFTDLAEANAILEVLRFQWETVQAIVSEKTYVGYLDSL